MKGGLLNINSRWVIQILARVTDSWFICSFQFVFGWEIAFISLTAYLSVVNDTSNRDDCYVKWGWDFWANVTRGRIGVSGLPLQITHMSIPPCISSYRHVKLQWETIRADWEGGCVLTRRWCKFSECEWIFKKRTTARRGLCISCGHIYSRRTGRDQHLKGFLIRNSMSHTSQRPQSIPWIATKRATPLPFLSSSSSSLFGNYFLIHAQCVRLFWQQLILPLFHWFSIFSN